MRKDPLQYDKMVEAALRDVVRQALAHTAEFGLPGNHHFYLTFNPRCAGVKMPEHLRAQHPGEMTIVLQHQFWGLEVKPEHFEVTLSFNDAHERLIIPFAALTSFVDPSVKFGLQLDAPAQPPQTRKPSVPAPVTPEAAAKGEPPKDLDKPAAEANKAEDKEEEEGGRDKVVSLDTFRKK